MRPIDADKFKSRLEKAMEKMHLTNGIKGVDVGAVIKALEMQPTLDVVPREEVETGLPCVAYNKKHERYQVIHKGKRGHIFASKMYRSRREAEVALAELKKKYTEVESNG